MEIKIQTTAKGKKKTEQEKKVFLIKNKWRFLVDGKIFLSDLFNKRISLLNIY